MNLREMASAYLKEERSHRPWIADEGHYVQQAYLAGALAVIELLRSDEAVWMDIEPRALSDKDRGTSSQWADWLHSKMGDGK